MFKVNFHLHCIDTVVHSGYALLLRNAGTIVDGGAKVRKKHISGPSCHLSGMDFPNFFFLSVDFKRENERAHFLEKND